ncbi:MAG TPA: DUF4388 domain-containing protein [Anaerolineales bacterium]
MQGKLGDFGIPDIFQLISSQGKSGSLAIRGDERETVFLFSEGLIVDVQTDRREPSGMLGTMLVDAGLITGQQLRKMLATQEKGGKKLGEALVERDMISGETLARYLSLQIKESLFEALRHREGDYRFESFAVRPPVWMTTPVRADVLMLEGMQYLDEYPIYRAKFPDGDFLAVRRAGEKVDVSVLSEEERRVWKGLEFSSEPRRVFRKVGLTWFEGIKGLWSLSDRGLVEISAPREEQHDPEAAFLEEKARIRNIGYLRAAAWFAVSVPLAAWIYAKLLSPAATGAFSMWVKFF